MITQLPMFVKEKQKGLTSLLWNTNDQDVIEGLSKWEVDMSELPTPSPDFDFLDNFDEVIMFPEPHRLYLKKRLSHYRLRFSLTK
jgi:hypothetical protein